MFFIVSKAMCFQYEIPSSEPTLEPRPNPPVFLAPK